MAFATTPAAAAHDSAGTHRFRPPAQPGLIADAAGETLGLRGSEVRSALGHGRTLAAMGRERGVSEAALVQGVLGALRAALPRGQSIDPDELTRIAKDIVAGRRHFALPLIGDRSAATEQAPAGLLDVLA